MSFDALTIGGLLVAIVSGGFLVGVVKNNDRRSGADGAEGHHDDHANSVQEHG
jgi:hypothetical protein